MKLKQFPLIMRAFHAIELDNGGTRARALIPEADIPDHWEVPFQVVERVFQQLGDHNVSMVHRLLTENTWEPSTKAWEVVALPVNEDDTIVMNQFGIHKTDQWLTNHLLYQFFDGELAGKFTTERRH